MKLPWRLLIVAGLATGLVIGQTLAARIVDDDEVHLFDGVAGPPQATRVPVTPPATSWRDRSEGARHRLAVFLTDPDSAWLGLAHGLESVGVPFRITDDPTIALEHRVVLAYPVITGRLPPELLQKLVAFVHGGGTLIAVNVLGGGLEPVFGFSRAVPRRDHARIRFDASQADAAAFDDPREREIRIATPGREGADLGAHDLLDPKHPPLAVYEDGAPAIVQRSFESGGRAVALGFDPGLLLLKAHNRRLEGVSDHYANGFEPSLDVLLRLLRGYYRRNEALATTLAPVPDGQALALVLTHDIDYSRSIRNAVVYAEHERSAGFSGTHFIQTKYVRDWNDEIFLNDENLPQLRRLVELGMEIGSHSVSHSRRFRQFAMGSGDERYPDYRPFVKSQTRTWGGTILGELRVSRFLLESLTGTRVDSFRPGHLENPMALPQALDATGFRYSSSVTANVSLSHLPFRLNYGRDSHSELPVYEFPITIEDELDGPMLERLDDAIDVARRIARHGGLYVVLIHPDELGDKLEFQRRLVAAIGEGAWRGSLGEFGRWWAAREAVRLDAQMTPSGAELRLVAPEPIAGLTLELPSGFEASGTLPPASRTTGDGRVVLGRIQGRVVIALQRTVRTPR